MRSILLAVLVGVSVTAAPAPAQPPAFQRDRDRDRDRGPSRESLELVNGWFVHFFHQPQPALKDVLFWGRQVDRVGNPDQVLGQMVGEDVYYDVSGSTPQGYVTNLFRDLTGRDPSRREFGYWMDRLFQIGGRSPDTEDRVNLAYEMLKRYPQNATPREQDRDHDDDYDYRRPAYRPDRR